MRIVHAPLKRWRIGEGEWLWYEPKFREGLTKIDLLLVDEPPGNVQQLSRYPMLPILFDLLDEEALILIDDGSRPGEKEIAARWSREYGCFDAKCVASEKGLIRLKRRRLPPRDVEGLRNGQDCSRE